MAFTEPTLCPARPRVADYGTGYFVGQPHEFREARMAPPKHCVFYCVYCLRIELTGRDPYTLAPKDEPE